MDVLGGKPEAGVTVGAVKNAIIWGNHSATQVNAGAERGRVRVKGRFL